MTWRGDAAAQTSRGGKLMEAWLADNWLAWWVVDRVQWMGARDDPD